MKLIDANELIKAIENENPGLSISGAVEKFARIAQVNMQPTVKAIPIEWIRNYVSIWVSEPYKNFVLNMITNWEKENEK